MPQLADALPATLAAHVQHLMGLRSGSSVGDTIVHLAAALQKGQHARGGGGGAASQLPPAVPVAAAASCTALEYTGAALAVGDFAGAGGPPGDLIITAYGRNGAGPYVDDALGVPAGPVTSQPNAAAAQPASRCGR